MLKDDATVGDKTFSVSIDSGSESKQVPLIAKITGANANTSSIRSALEIGLIILVVILIIVGLVIGFGKMKENKHTTEPYY